jgi:hypothetical protein
MFFSYRHQGEADAYPSWRLLVDRFAVQMHISGSYSAISDAIIEAVGSSDLAGQAAFFRHCADIFGQVQCWDEGFGRGPWADIAQTACDYLAGVLPRPIFVDHVFDLQHHGRAMFNNDVMVCAKTCELVLHQQLAAKKEATAVGALYKALMALHCCHQTVSDLYEAGLALGLWA